MADALGGTASKGVKNAARATGGIRVQEIKRLTVEIVVFSPEITPGHEQSFMESMSNPGHVAMRMDNTLYDFGRYGEHGLWSGDGILSKDDFQQELRSHIAKRTWIYGFVVVVRDLEAIKARIEAAWKGGKPRPRSNKPRGRRIGEYNLASNSCKTFTLDNLTAGGVEIPDYFGWSDYPHAVRDNFLRWNREDPKTVIKVNPYKSDPVLATAR